MAGLIVLLVLIVFALFIAARTVRVIPQARAGVVERFGRYSRTLQPGLTIVVPFIDKVRYLIDLREQVVSFPPQPVITEDNLVVSIDTVIYFQVTDPIFATYEIANYIQAVEQLTVTTLRNVVGSMNLEQTLTSRDEINTKLRGELDDATGKWGIRVARVELKAIDPPPSIQDAMEKQMRADRDKRAIILQAEGNRESSIKTAEGQKAAQILAAEGAKQSAILAAEAERQSRILRAEGERAARYLAAQGQAKAIETVFASIHAADPDPKLLAYQYLQTLPRLAQGSSNKLWIVPSELGEALKGIGGVLGGLQPANGTAAAAGNGTGAAATRRDPSPDGGMFEPTLQDPNEALAEARRDAAGASAEAEGAATAGVHPGPMPSRSAGRPQGLGPVDPDPGAPVDSGQGGPVEPERPS